VAATVIAALNKKRIATARMDEVTQKTTIAINVPSRRGLKMSESSGSCFPRALLGVTLLLMVAGLAGAVGWVLRGELDRPQRLVKSEKSVQSNSQKEKADLKAPEPDREPKIRSYLSQAQTARNAQEPGYRSVALQNLRSAAALKPPTALQLELRNEAIASLAIPLGLSTGKTWEGWPAGSVHLDFDSQLQVYARSDRRGNVSVRRVSDDKEISRIADGKGDTWVRLSPDGRFLLTHYRDSLRIWQLGKSKPAILLERQGRAYDFHREKPWVAIAVKDGFLEVIDLTEGKSQHYKAVRNVEAVAWHPRVNQLALSCSEGVKVLDLESEHVVATLETHAAPGLQSLAWHPEGRMLAVASTDNRVQLWNIEDEQKVVVLAGPTRRETCVSFDCGGNLLATTAEDGNLRLWDPRTGRQLKRLAWGCNEVPRFSADDRFVAARVADSRVQIWEVGLADEYRMLPVLQQGSCDAVAIGLEGRLLAAALDDGVALWDLKSATLIGLVETGPAHCAVFEQVAPGALWVGGSKGVQRWPVQFDVHTSRLRLGPAEELSATGNRLAIAVSPDGRFVIQAAGTSGAHVFWRDPKKSLELAHHSDVHYVAVSSDGQWVATGTQHGVGAKVWEARTGKLVQELLPKAPSLAVEFSADGQWLATQSPKVQLWKAGTWENTTTVSGTQFAFTPDGKVLAVETGAGVIRLLDLSNGQELASLQNSSRDAAHRLVFSPDGALLVALGSDMDLLHVWDLRKLRRRLADLNLDWDSPAYPAPGPSWNGGRLQFVGSGQDHPLSVAMSPYWPLRKLPTR
jgi:eukaryotic-like serine/threonine-protein kinase